MDEDPEKYFFTLDSVEFCVAETCLAKLLEDDVLFASGRKYICPTGGEQPQTVVLFVSCNDIFAWACADSEELPHAEIGPLFKMHQADPQWGAAKWCMLRRNQKPQKPVEKLMREAGSWDETLDQLGENTLDAETQAIFASLKAKT